MFFGTKATGLANAILAPAFGIFLLIYALGAARALGGADGLDLCCVRAHQPDALHDKDSGKVAVAVLRLSLRRDRARRLVGLGNPAYSPHPATVLKVRFSKNCETLTRLHDAAFAPS